MKEIEYYYVKLFFFFFFAYVLSYKIYILRDVSIGLYKFCSLIYVKEESSQLFLSAHLPKPRLHREEKIYLKYIVSEMMVRKFVFIFENRRRTQKKCSGVCMFLKMSGISYQLSPTTIPKKRRSAASPHFSGRGIKCCSLVHIHFSQLTPSNATRPNTAVW